MNPVTERRCWNPCYLLIWFGILSLGLSVIRGQSNQPKNSLEDELKLKENPNYGPIFSVPRGVTGSLVSDTENVPKGYISQNGNDIGSKAERDDWSQYLESQDGLKILIFLLLLLFLVVPILGILYAIFCVRIRRFRRYSKGMCYFCTVLLAISAILMLLFLIFSMLAATQLNRSLKRTGHCKLQNNSNQTNENHISNMRRLYVSSYKQLLRQIEGVRESAPNVTKSYLEAEVLAVTIEKLTDVLRNMQQVKPLLAELNDELPRAKWFAIRFRYVLVGIKRNLKVFLTSQCGLEECQVFYRDNEIEMLDGGCLHYERLPAMQDFSISIQNLLDSHFIAYPRLAAQQLRQSAMAIRDQMSNLLETIQKDLHKGAKQLQEKYEALLVKHRANDTESPTEETAKAVSPPAAALRRKLGRSWYRTTLGMMVLFMLVPLLLLIGLLVILCSPNVASWVLCAGLVAIFVLFSLALLIVLFFLVHGALTYQAFYSGQDSQEATNKSMNLFEYDYLPQLRVGDVPQRCLRNESLDLKDLYDHMKKDIQKSLEKMESATLPSNLSSIYPQAAAAAQELLRGNISSYNSSHFTQHMCLELVPEPRPGPLPVLISRLNKLTRRLGSPPMLLNQTIYLRAAHTQLGQPLGVIIQQLLDKFKQLDHLLSGGYGSFAEYMGRLLAKIKQSEQFLSRNANKVTRNISYFMESALDKKVPDVADEMENCAPLNRQENLVPLTRQESRLMVEHNDLFNRIANPMNALWFWLLLFALMLLPALCCTHYLRRHLARPKDNSMETLVSLGEENFVAASMMPITLPLTLHCYKYLPAAQETNVDQLAATNENCVDQDYR